MIKQKTQSEYLREDVAADLYPFQIERIDRQIHEMKSINDAAEKYTFNECPKCHHKNPRIGAGGRAGSGKVMLKCFECGRRFTYDHGQLSWYSHQDESKWVQLIKDTIEGQSLIQTAADIDVSEATAFRMRHKLLAFTESITESVSISHPCEVDETFFEEAHKGYCSKERNSRKRGARKRYRGISEDLICVTTGIERSGAGYHQCTYIEAYNTGRPRIDEIRPFFVKHIRKHTYMWVDGERCFPKLMEEMECPYRIVKSTVRPDQVNHLNNANSLHNRIQGAIRDYRGISSIYINRYNSLFTIKELYRDCDTTEIVLHIMNRLHRIIRYFFINDIRDYQIFDNPYVLRNRGIECIDHDTWKLRHPVVHYACV